MKPHHLPTAFRVSKPTILILLFAVSSAVLCAVGILASAAHSTRKEEREVEDTLPKHLPIKVKLRNAEKVKDLKNGRWPRDFELEIVNTSDRPIYYLNIGLSMPEVKAPDGSEIGFTFKYGRRELVDYTVLPGPDDVPILPGATHVLKIPEQSLKNWESVHDNFPNPRRLRLKLHYLNFGDGTGLYGPEGTPWGGKQSSGSGN